MKKYSGFILLLLLYAMPCFGQRQNVDSLLKALDAHPTQDSIQAGILRLIARSYRNSNSTKAVDYYTKAIAAASVANSPAYIARLCYDRGHSYYDAGNLNAAVADYITAAKSYEATNDSNNLFETYISIGNVYSDLLNYEKVNEYYTRAEHYIDKETDSLSMQTIYGQWGIIYDKRKLFDSAMLNFEKALQVTNPKGNGDAAMNVLSNIGLSYKHKGDITKALFYYDSAISVYKSANDGDLFAGGALYNNLASAYTKAGKINEALTAFNTSLDYAKAAGAQSIEMENYINMADMYGSVKDYKNQALYLQKHYALKDSLFNTDKQNQLTELEADYQMSKKNEELLKKDVEVTSANATRNTVAIIGGSVLLLAIGLFYFLSKTRKINALLARQNLEINQQRNELQKLNTIKDRLFSIVSHDLRNPLATLQSYLSLSGNANITAEKQAALKQQTYSLVAQTSDLLDNLLNWAHSQMQGAAITIKQVEINPVLQDCFDLVLPQAKQKNITINYHPEHERMALGDEHALSVVFRNLLTNAVKFTHTGGTIHINSAIKNDMIAVTVKDTGTGMDAATVQRIMNSEAASTAGTGNEKGTGLGILLVLDLVQKMNGKLEIDSTPGMGSAFCVYLQKL